MEAFLKITSNNSFPRLTHIDRLELINKSNKQMSLELDWETQECFAGLGKIRNKYVANYAFEPATVCVDGNMPAYDNPEFDYICNLLCETSDIVLTMGFSALADGDDDYDYAAELTDLNVTFGLRLGMEEKVVSFSSEHVIVENEEY